MRVLELWRYPVKSVGGEQLDEADITATGIAQDRGWGIVDRQTGLVLTARRAPKLLMATAHIEDSAPLITTADGHRLRDDDDLSEWLDRPVTLTAASGKPGGTYENPRDIKDETNWIRWQGPPDAWHDSTRTRISILGRVTLGSRDSRRFRANVLIDTDQEDTLVGRRVKLGTSQLEVTKRIDRCVMVTRAQPGLARDRGILHDIVREGGCLGVGALVAVPGRATIGDELTT